jgi:hypothetical protein
LSLTKGWRKIYRLEELSDGTQVLYKKKKMKGEQRAI